MERRDMMGRAQLRKAADRLFQSILDDEQLVDLLTAGRVRALIDSGELVERDTLTLGAGAQVIATAELERLRDRQMRLEWAVHYAQVELDRGNVETALAYLDEAREPEQPQIGDGAEHLEPAAEPEPEPEVEVEPVEPPPAPAPDPNPELAAPAPAPDPKPQLAGPPVRVPPEVKDEVDETGRPVGMPALNSVHACEWESCPDRKVPGEQAQFSWTRFRRVLCRPHMVQQPQITPEPDHEVEAEAS